MSNVSQWRQGEDGSLWFLGHDGNWKPYSQSHVRPGRPPVTARSASTSDSILRRLIEALSPKKDR